MPDAIDAARKLITDRLRELEAETKALERALGSMGDTDGSSTRARKPRRKRGAAKARRRRAKAPRGRRREQLLAALAAKPGARPAELAAEIGIAPSHVSALLAKARAEKLVVKKGTGYELKK
jgi:hypothetical protein